MQTNDLLQFRKYLLMLEREMLYRTRCDSPCCGVTPSQCRVLLEIDEAGTASVSGLAFSLGLDSSSLSRAVDGLVECGCVSRMENEKDRRFSRVALTESGKKTVEKINRGFDDVLSSVLENVPGSEHQSIIEAIKSIACILMEMRLKENQTDQNKSEQEAGAPAIGYRKNRRGGEVR